MLSLTAGVDHEATETLSVVVAATDDKGGVTQQTITVAIDDIDEAPTAEDASASTAEATAVDIDVADLIADPEDRTLTVEATVAAALGTVSVDGTVITFTPAAGITGDVAIAYTVSDGTNSTGATLTVAVSDTDAPANGLTLTAVSFDENALGAVVASIVVDDPDTTYAPGDFEVVGDDATNYEVVDDGGLVLKLKGDVALDAEATVAEVSVRLAGQPDIAATLTPAPANVDEAATELTLTAIDVAENVEGAPVAKIAVADVDTTYTAADVTLTGADAGDFEAVDGPDGIVLKLRDGVSLDADQASQPSVTVGVAGLSQSFTPAPSDVDEGGPTRVLFNGAITAYGGGQDRPGDGGTGVTVSGDGSVLTLDGNLWKRVALPESYVVTEATVLSVDLQIAGSSEIAAIGFDTNNNPFDRQGGIFQLAGSQPQGSFTQVTGETVNGVQRFVIPLDDYVGKTLNSLVFIADDDNKRDGLATVTFSNVTLEELDLGNRAPEVVGGGVADFAIDERGRLEVDLPFVDRDGDPLTYTVAIEDGDGNDVSEAFGLSDPSGGLGLSGRVLSGTLPTVVAPGVYTVKLTASDGEATTPSSFQLTVADVNDAPIADDVAFEPIFGAVGEAFVPVDIANFAFAFSDPDGDDLTFSVEGLPLGLTLNSEGVIVGTPTERGTGSFTIVASDGELTARVAVPLQITAPAAGDVVEVEAEFFTGLPTNGIISTGVAGASNNQIIQAKSGGNITVTSDLSRNGVSEGWYKVSLVVYDETDGSAPFSLKIGDTVVSAPGATYSDPGTWLNGNGSTNRGAGGQSGNRKQLDFDTVVYVSEGTILTLSGRAAGELLRTDKVIFTRVDAPDLAPTSVAISADTVAENADGAIVGALSATDPDGDDAAITFTVDPASDFEVVDGVLKLKDGIAADHEAGATRTVVVTATDEDGSSSQAALTVNVSDVDEAPEGLTLSNATVAENAAGAVIGTLSAVDPEGTDVTFSVPAGSPFEVDGATLKLKADFAADFEAQASLSVDVTATDATGQTTTQTLTIAVEDGDDAPSGITLVGDPSVDENAAGAVIGTLQSTDDDGTAVSFTVSDDRFTVDGDDQLTLKEGVSLDHETEASVTVTVTATDGTGAAVTQDFVLAVNDVNEAPTLAGGASLDDVTFALGAGGTVDLAGLGASDVDDGPAPTYAVRGVNGAALPDGFAVTNGVLTVPAGTAAGAYEVEVFATDGTLDSDSVFFTVTVGEPEPFTAVILQGEAFNLINAANDSNPNLIRTETQNWERDGSPLNPEPNSTPANPNNEEFNTIGLRPDYSGDGYLDLQGTDTGAQASVAFDAPAGTYAVTVRLANGSDQARPITLDFGNGDTVTLANTTTAEWYEWETRTVEVTLTGDGPRTLTISQDAAQGAPNIDAIAVHAPGTTVDFFAGEVTDDTADADGNLAAAPVDASVEADARGAVAINLTGIDDDIATIEVALGGGAFAPASVAGTGEDRVVTVDLSAFTPGTSVDVALRVTDGAGNQATRTTSVAIDAVDPQQPFSFELQLEARDGSVTIFDDTGGGNNNTNLTQIRDPQNAEQPDALKGADGLWDNFTGAGYLDMGLNAGDAFAFDVSVPADGEYTFSFRYAHTTVAGRPMTITVDGGAAETIAFPGTGAFDTWQEATITLTLEAGSNTIRLANVGNTGPNIDRVVVTGEVDPVDPGTEPGPRETIRINFQDGSAPKADGYLVANFEGFADQGNGLSYGFVTEASAIDADGTTATPIDGASFPAIAINERSGSETLPNDGSLPAGRTGTINVDGYDARLLGYAHTDLPSYNGQRAAFELALANGWYEVTVAVGDTAGPNDSDNRLFVEGNLVAEWTPTAAFKTELVTTVVKVEDGFLTLDGRGGSVTELQYLDVRALPDLTPGDGREAPEDYAKFVNPRAVSASAEVNLGVDDGALPVGIDPTADIVLGIDVVDGRGGALLESLRDGSVRLFETLTGQEVAYNANTTGGFDSVTIAPANDLKPHTSYTLVIDGFQDRGDNDDTGAPSREFQKFSNTFVTGAPPEVVDREVAFRDTVELTSNPFEGESYTSIEMSPDKSMLYVTSISGTITRWAVNADGSIDQSSEEVFVPGGDFNEGGGRRGFIGMAFDPEDANTIWVTDNYPIPLSGRSNSVPDFSGRISKITLGDGGSLEDATIETFATGLPRSNGDHVTNSLEFRANPDAGQPGEPDFLLYLTQGSNSAMGEADTAWGFRPERLLNAAILEIDRTKTPPEGGFDLATEPLPADGLNRRFADSDGDLKNGGIAITSGEYQGNFLHFAQDGVATVRETANASSTVVKEFYDPFADDAPVTIFATGTRNAYDLVWHSNGFLYVPTNGSAAGGNVPNNPDTPQNEAINGVGLQSDYLFRIVEGRYYGHPNPLHDQFVLNGGNPTSGPDKNQVGNYPVGTQPEADYDLDGAYSVGNNRSPNGAIEYVSNVFGGSLQNAVIFTQYSSGDNLRAVLFNPDGTVREDFVLRDEAGDIISYVDPLDVIEGPGGRLYMLTLDRGTGISKIVRLDAVAGSTVGDTSADEDNNLAFQVVDATDPAAVVLKVTGVDGDVVAIEVDFGDGPVTVSPNTQGEFTVDLSGTTGSVTATLQVEDDASNTASRTTTFTVGTPAAGSIVVDAGEFNVLDTNDGTLLRLIDVPASHESTSTTDLDGDGLNDGYDGRGYLDPNGGAEDKASFTVSVTQGGTYDLTFRIANGSATQARPIALKVDGDTVATIADTRTGSFGTWQDFTVTFRLDAGTNTVVIAQSATNGAPNIDSVTIVPNTLDAPAVPNDGTETVGGVTYVKYEAETAASTGEPAIATEERGQSGDAFVDFVGPDTETLTFTVAVAEDGAYAVDFLYALAAGKTARPMGLSVDGNPVGTLAFAANSNTAETNWGPQSVVLSLTAGTHTITVSAPGGVGPNVDYLRISQAPVDVFEPTYEAISGEGRIEVEATDGTARVVDADTVEAYFTVDADGAYAIDVAANAGAPNGGGVTFLLGADGGTPVEIGDEAWPATGESTAYVNLTAGVEYRLVLHSDAAGASALDYVDVRAAPGNENADIEVMSLDPAFLDNRLHFSWIDNPSVPDEDGQAIADRDMKGSATVRISNSGTEALEVLSHELTGPFDLANPAQLDGLVIAAGQFVDVTVDFDRSEFGPTRGDGQNGVFTGALTLRTNDADSPFTTVDLAGFWQPVDEGGREPNVNEVWEVFGFGNTIDGLKLTGGGENSVLNFFDLYIPVDETEVLSPYFQLADGVSQAKITQIAAFHGPGPASLAIHNPANKGQTAQGMSHQGTDNQRLLPNGNGDNGFVSKSFGNGQIPDGWQGDDAFGIVMAGLSTNPTLNPSGSDVPQQSDMTGRYAGYTVTGGEVFDPNGNPVPDGYTVRMFQAVDEDGNAIANTYLGVMDYTGINYDYNDNMFVIEGVQAIGFGQDIAISGLDDAAADDRLVFSRIDNKANGAQGVRDEATFTISNDGFGPLKLAGLNIVGDDAASFEIVSGPSANSILAAGASATVTVRYVGTDTANDDAAVLHEAALEIRSDDFDEGVRTVQLAGLAQIQSEGGEEPTVAQIVEAFGYSTNVAQGELAGGGVVETVGDEVLLPYLERLDGSQPVEVIQLAAYLSLGNVGRLNSHGLANDDLTELYVSAGNFAQSVLPDSPAGNEARATFNPTGGFGLKVTVDGRPTFSAWTDPVANDLDPAFNGLNTGEGHYIRFFEAKDADGNVIEGTYIGVQDYPGGHNFDYNDHMFLIRNVKAHALTTAEDGNGDGVNDALQSNIDNDALVDFFDNTDDRPVVADQQPFPGPSAPTFANGALTIDASNYDTGGQGVAYNDAPGLAGGTNGGRTGSDVEQTGLGDVGYINTGEWLEYTINVAEAGLYDLEALLATNGGPGRTATFEFYRNGETTPYESTGPIANPLTGGWTNYLPRGAEGIELEAGLQVVRVTFSGSQDFRSFKLTQQDDSNQAPTTTGISGAPNGQANSAYTFDVAGFFDDPDGDALSYSLANAPQGLSINGAGLISGTPAAGGTFNVQVTASDGELSATSTFALTVAAAPPVDNGQTPFPGPNAPTFAAGALTVDASNYDNGGQGVAYNDASGLQGGTNGGRTGSAVEQTSGGDIGWIASGEWLEYTIEVAAAGSYDLDLLLATSGGGRSVKVDFTKPGASSPYETQTIANPSTGSYTNFQERSATVDLDAGTQVVRVTFTNAQDFRSFTLTSLEPNQTPFPGPDAPTFTDGTLTVLAQNFDQGGQGVSWQDSAAKQGGNLSVRPDTGVEFVGSANDIGYIEAGEWVEYTVDAPTAGTYNLSVVAKTPIGGNSIAVSLEDGAPVATIVLPDSNGTSTSFTGTTFAPTAPVAVDLDAGVNTLRFTFGGTPASNGYLADFRSLTLEAVEPSAVNLSGFDGGSASSAALFSDADPLFGGDTETIRLPGLSSTEATLLMEEEQAGRTEASDTEVSPVMELVGSAAFLIEDQTELF